MVHALNMTEPASARRREVVQAQEAAEHALSYFESMHANWIPSSNLTDPARYCARHAESFYRKRRKVPN